jgi:hypothetical protein
MKKASVQQLLFQRAPLSPLSSRPERTRISYFALLATTTYAALRKESRMQLINATTLDRKSGGAWWRELCADVLSWKSLTEGDQRLLCSLFCDKRAGGHPNLVFGMAYHSALRLRVKINADVRRHIHRLTVANKRLVAPEPHGIRSLGFQRTIS